jgi:hypothetical protein
MLKMIRQKASTVYPAFTKEMLAKKSDDDLLERMDIVFKNLRVVYAKNDRSNLDSDASEEENEEYRKQRNRRSQRKARVSWSANPQNPYLTSSLESRGEDESGHRLSDGYTRHRMVLQAGIPVHGRVRCNTSVRSRYRC